MPTLHSIKTFFKKGDLVLLVLCLIASAFSLILVYSATRWTAARESDFEKQALFIVAGIVAYVIMTFVDVEYALQKFWPLLFLFSVGLLLLLIPFGAGGEETGNSNWIFIPGIPFGIQPAEIVKLFFVPLLALILDKSRKRGISRISSVLFMAGFTLFFMGLNTVLSHDFGMSLVFFFIFAIMAFTAGVKLRWFVLALLGGSGLAAAVWTHLPPNMNYIKMRFLILFDHSLDPQGIGWHQTRSLLAIGSGQLTGMGWLNGTQTHSPRSDSLPERHTDFIFSVCGEEFGLIGCCVLLLVLLLIILRCIQVSRMAKDHLSAYMALGFAGMLMTQTIINVGMCLFVAPVVGLTLPFISYGGTSVLTMYACMGIVSGVKMRTLPSWIKDRSNL